MLYRNFAIATLLAAPIIVMGVQAFLPQSGSAVPDQAAQSAAPPPPVPVPVAPPVAPPGVPSASTTSDFGQPMAGAGQPMLAPGEGLPVTAPAAPPASFAANGSPEGSPNAE